MHKKNWIALVAVVLIVSLSWIGAQATSMLQAQPTSVAVIDLKGVIDGLTARTELEADVRQQREELAQQEQDKRQEIAAMRTELDALEPGSDDYRRKEQELQRSVIDLQVWTQFQQQLLARSSALEVQNLFRQVREVAGRVAADNGYDLVLFKDQQLNLPGGGEQAAASVFIVAWSSDAIDLSDQVITRMNNEFNAAQ